MAAVGAPFQSSSDLSMAYDTLQMFTRNKYVFDVMEHDGRDYC